MLGWGLSQASARTRALGETSPRTCRGRPHLRRRRDPCPRPHGTPDFFATSGDFLTPLRRPAPQNLRPQQPPAPQRPGPPPNAGRSPPPRTSRSATHPMFLGARRNEKYTKLRDVENERRDWRTSRKSNRNLKKFSPGSKEIDFSLRNRLPQSGTELLHARPNRHRIQPPCPEVFC